MVLAMRILRRQLAKMLDHTLVKSDVTKDDVKKVCVEAETYGFCCVCVNPTYVSLATHFLKETNVKVSSTVGFPFGVTLPEVKTFEAWRALENGAREVDMVVNLSMLKSGNYEMVRKDIEMVVDVKRLYREVTVKVIIETGLLTDEEKVLACKIAKEAGADFVKTATGFFGGATVEDVRLMRETVGREMGVKAAGGIRTLPQALAMIEAGANRIRTSTAVAIIKELPK
jgi:deoxyribose-phosphate aldolase